MSENRELNFTAKNGEYAVFCGEEPLFFSGKQSPFIFLVLEKDSVIKEIPLYNCNIEKRNSGWIFAKFFTGNLSVNCNFKRTGNGVFCFIEKRTPPQYKVKFCLAKKNGRVTGCGLNLRKDLAKQTIREFGKNENKLGVLDVKLNFSVKNSYSFSGCGIVGWEAEFGKTINITSAQREIKFYLEFEKQHHLSVNSGLIIREIYEEKQFKIKVKNKASILENSVLFSYDGNANLLEKKVKKAKKQGLKVFIKISPLIDKNNITEQVYQFENCHKFEGNKYLIRTVNENNMRVFSNYIRSILDKNIDGLYIDERQIKVNEQTEFDEVLIYKKFRDFINRLCSEYTPKQILFNKLNASEKKDSIYCFDYEKISSKQKMYMDAILYSDIGEICFECKERSGFKLLKNGFQSLLIKE